MLLIGHYGPGLRVLYKRRRVRLHFAPPHWPGQPRGVTIPDWRGARVWEVA